MWITLRKLQAKGAPICLSTRHPIAQLVKLKSTTLNAYSISSLRADEQSCPIEEIAWFRPNQNLSDTFLIKPAKAWVYWDEVSEFNYHGISQSELAEQGIDVHSASQRLNRSLSGINVTVDSYVFDTFWLKRLFDASNTEMAFAVVPMIADLPEYSRPHQALPDVMAQFEAWKHWAYQHWSLADLNLYSENTMFEEAMSKKLLVLTKEMIRKHKLATGKIEKDPKAHRVRPYEIHPDYQVEMRWKGRSVG